MDLPKRFELMEKTELLGEKEKKKVFLAPQPTSIYKLSMTPVVQNISIGHLGLAVWLCSLPAPAHLVIS